MSNKEGKIPRLGSKFHSFEHFGSMYEVLRGCYLHPFISKYGLKRDAERFRSGYDGLRKPVFKTAFLFWNEGGGKKAHIEGVEISARDAFVLAAVAFYYPRY